MFDYELKLKFKQSHLSTFIVITVYITLIIVLNYTTINFSISSKTSTVPNDNSDTEEYFEVELENYNSQQTLKTLSAGQLYSKNPDMYIFKLKDKKKKSGNKKLDDFLNSLSNKMSSVTSDKIVIKSAAINKTIIKPANNIKKNNNTINYAAFSKNENSSTNINEKILRKSISNHQEQFQRCYEMALLKDELLSGNAYISVKSGIGNTKVNFKGIGKTNSIKSLKSCLIQMGNKLHFPSNTHGKTIKFSLFFNS